MIARIGKYTIERELGHGGFGDVFLAFDPDVGQKVAIKHLRVELGTDPDMLKRFQHEIRTTAGLRHRNIVTIHASGVENGNPYLVMEYLEGKTLKETIQTHVPLTLLEKVGIMTQVAEGLAYAHSKGVVHRDVKPENIMILPDGSAKIMDFGIALAADRNTVMTETGGIIGTPPYFSPEQLQGYKANEQSDIFSLGDVYYELVAGQHPFERFKHHPNALQMAIMSFDPPAVSQLEPNCPEALELLVHRMIAKEREFRYATFDELLLDSKSILVDLQHDRAAALIREVPTLVESGDLQSALARLREAQQLEPGNREARQLRDTITQRLQKAQVQGRVAELLAEADAFMGERRFAEAVKCLETAARLDSSHIGVQVRLGDAKARQDSSSRASRLVSEARFNQQKGHLTEALERLTAALAIDPDHTEAVALCPRVREAVERERLEQAKAEEERVRRTEKFNLGVTLTREAMQAGELDRAEQMIGHLVANFSGEPGAAAVLPALREQLQAQVRAQQIAVCQKEARDLLQKKSYREALDLLAEALRKFGDDTGLERLHKSAEDLDQAHRRSEAIASVIKEAGGMRDAGRFREALDSVSEARKRLGDEAAFVELARQLEVEIEHQRYAAGLEKLLHAGRELLAASKYFEAIDRLAREPEYGGEAEVRALQESARVSAAVEQERTVVAEALGAAERLNAQGEAAAALEAVEEALARYPDAPALQGAGDRFREQIARERRRATIERHRSTIRREIQAGAWEKAEAALLYARSEFPDERAFDDLSELVEAGLNNARLDEVAARVRDKLATGNLPGAEEQIEATRTVFAHDTRWKSLAQEVARQHAYEAALVEAERLRNEGDLSKAENLLDAAIRAGPADQRALQAIDAIRAERSEALRQMEIAAAAARVRERLKRDDVQQAAVELDQARAKYPGHGLWAALQGEMEARQSSIRRQAGIRACVESVRNYLKREEMDQAAAGLAAARAQYPDEGSWAVLQTEIDERRELVRQRAAISKCAESVRRCLARDDLSQASVELNTGRAKYPGEKLWAALEAEIDARHESLRQQAEIAAIAETVRGLLKRDDLRGATGELGAARSKYPGESLWATLEAEITARQALLHRQAEIDTVAQGIRGCLERDDLRQAVAQFRAGRTKYPGESLWATLDAEIGERQALLKRLGEIAAVTESVRTSIGRDNLLEASGKLRMAQAKYPGEGVWETLEAEIEARQGVLKRLAETEATARSIRGCLTRDDLRQAASELAMARAQYPGESLWAALETEIDARQSAREAVALEARRREQELQEAQSQAESLLGQGRPAEALALIEGRFAADPRVQELIARARGDLDRKQRQSDLDRLLAIEQQLERTPQKRKVRGLDAEAHGIAGRRVPDEEFASIASRIHARAVSILEAPSAKKPLLWKLVGGAAAAAVVIAALALGFRNKTPNEPPVEPVKVATTFPVEIRTVPPGASVRVGELSCVTPDCRFHLAPGPFEVRATLKGYEPATKTVTVDAKSPNLVELTLVQPPLESGTLAVLAGLAGVRVVVDGIARGLTDAGGRLDVSLEAKNHDVRLEKERYQPASRPVQILQGGVQQVSFTLLPKEAKIELLSAPSGVELRLDAKLLGRTDGSADFPFSGTVTPGRKTLQVSEGGVSWPYPHEFQPEETLRLLWKDVAASKPVVKPPQPGPNPPPPEDAPLVAYRGPFFWRSRLENGDTVVINARKPLPKRLDGMLLPGVPVTVKALTPGVVIVQQPSAANQWGSFTIRNDSGRALDLIRLEWQQIR